MRLTKTRNKYGGEVIGAGGYGCVFNPALRCNNSKKRTSGISKLSSVFDSNKEWNEIQRVKRYLEKIPNYKNYFLLSDQNKCTPSALTEKDKNNLELCDSILKIVGNIDRENINSNLQKLQIINMPYGGKSLHNILINNIVPIENINIILINLLINGIIPMNNFNVYHFDVKGDNMLYNDNLIRIIDFGELGISHPEQIIPDVLHNRMILFNSPFSRILFGSIFDNFLTVYLQNNIINKNSKILFKELQLLMLTYYNSLISQYGEGHEKFISKNILLNIFRLNKMNIPIQINLLEYLLTSYCATVLMKYLDFNTKTFNKNKYFEEVFSKNVDVYGLIMAYIPIIMQINVSKKYKQQQIIVANIIIKYCLSNRYANKPINLSELISDLKELNTPIQNKKLDIYLLKQNSKKIKSKRTKSKRTKSKRTKSKKSRKK